MAKMGTAWRQVAVTDGVRRRLSEVQDGLGFDASRVDGTDGSIRVVCSQCEALVINGSPTHEHGCVNATKACRGCDARMPAVPRWSRYCDACQDGEV